MGLGLSMLVAATSVLAANPAPSDPASNSIADEASTIAHLMFDLDLKTFSRQYLSIRRTNTALDWTTDGCSAPVVGESGRSFNFRNACIRHDFGYRNYKAHGLLSTESRLRLDEQFRQDMYTLCGPKIRTFKVRCAAWAEIFYAAVRAGGGP